MAAVGGLSTNSLLKLTLLQKTGCLRMAAVGGLSTNSLLKLTLLQTEDWMFKYGGGGRPAHQYSTQAAYLAPEDWMFKYGGGGQPVHQ